jgi:hypothetical protein
MRRTPEVLGHSLVFIGKLNPAIFQPQWFARTGLLSDAQAEDIKIEVIHPEVSILDSSSFRLEVDQQRFVIRPLDEPFVKIHDLALRIFGEFLTHTPLHMMGINCYAHFNLRDSKLRDTIGEKLSPREPWGEWGPLIGSGTGRRHGGMRSLTMEQRDLEDRPEGWIRAKIEPSNRLQSDQGIFIDVNDHYQVRKDVEPNGTRNDSIAERQFRQFSPTIVLDYRSDNGTRR